MFKKIIFSMMLLCCIVFVMSSVDVYASYNYTITTYYEEPSCTGQWGYVVVLYNDGSYDIVSIYARQHFDSEEAVSVQVGINNFSLDVLVNGREHDGSGGVVYKQVFATKYSSSDGLERVVIDSDFTNNYGYYSVSLRNSIKAFIVRGDIYRYKDNVFGGSHPTVSVSWGNDKYMITQLEAIKTAIRQSNGNDSSIVAELNAIKSEQMLTNDYARELLSLVYDYYPAFENSLNDIDRELEFVNSNIDLMIEEQKKTNTWLEKIFEHLQESQEQQKQEAEKQGSNSTSQGMNAIEDKGAGFTSSLGGLTSSMSYSGTQCAWEFPEVKLPAIAGVMDEVVLIRKQPIDFAVWVNAIPSDILIVVQSLCTIGLIVFCFKELYGTIEYVLTLRKGGGSDE